MDILLIEDHTDTAIAYARVLRKDRHYVEIASNCAEAVQLFRESFFDVLLCDIGLPDGDGWHLLADLLKVRYVKAIALTAHGMPQDKEHSEKAGFVAHVTKPIDICQLRKVLEDVDRGKFDMDFDSGIPGMPMT